MHVPRRRKAWSIIGLVAMFAILAPVTNTNAVNISTAPTGAVVVGTHPTTLNTSAPTPGGPLSATLPTTANVVTAPTGAVDVGASTLALAPPSVRWHVT